MFKYILYCLHLLYVRSNDYTVRSYMYVRIFDVRTLVNMCKYNCTYVQYISYVHMSVRTHRYVRSHWFCYTVSSFCTHVRVVRTHVML